LSNLRQDAFYRRKKTFKWGVGVWLVSLGLVCLAVKVLSWVIILFPQTSTTLAVSYSLYHLNSAVMIMLYVFVSISFIHYGYQIKQLLTRVYCDSFFIQTEQKDQVESQTFHHLDQTHLFLWCVFFVRPNSNGNHWYMD
jgi:magnesium-transporting ATPase (P-type)